MKREYSQPTINVIELDNLDIITGSQTGDLGGFPLEGDDDE